MKIIEQCCIGKNGKEKNEDGLVITEDFIAVIDGSTSKSKLPPLDCGLTHGQISRNAVISAVRTAEPRIDLRSFCHECTKAVQREYTVHYNDDYRRMNFGGQDATDYLRQHPEDRFTCSAIVYSKHRNEIWMIGDCQCLIVDTLAAGDHGMHHTNDKPMEAQLALQRAECLKGLIAEGASIDELRADDAGRRFILPSLVMSMRGQNVTYAVIDGFDIPVNRVKVIESVMLNHNKEIILASDGYPCLKPTLEATESELRQIVESDPLCIGRYKATKGLRPGATSFDDRTYVRFAL